LLGSVLSRGLLFGLRFVRAGAWLSKQVPPPASRLVRRPVRPFCSSSIRPRGAYRRRPPPSRRARCPQIASGAFTPGSLTFRASSVGLTIGDVTLAALSVSCELFVLVVSCAQPRSRRQTRDVRLRLRCARRCSVCSVRSVRFVRFSALAGHPSLHALWARPRVAGFSGGPLPPVLRRRGCSAVGVLSSVLRGSRTRSSGRGLPRRSRATTAPELGAPVQASCGESGADAACA